MALPPSDVASSSSASYAIGSHGGVLLEVPICLDFLKGNCVRQRCRFLHPDLTRYEQLSKAVRAQAGRRLCEVWALTGKCKFGPKCSRLHPTVVVDPQPQAGLALLLPLPVAPAPAPQPSLAQAQAEWLPPSQPASSRSVPPPVLHVGQATPLVAVLPPDPAIVCASVPYLTCLPVLTQPLHLPTMLADPPSRGPAGLPPSPPPGPLVAAPSAGPPHAVPLYAAAPPPPGLPQPSRSSLEPPNRHSTSDPIISKWSVQINGRSLEYLFGTHRAERCLLPLLALPSPTLRLPQNFPIPSPHPHAADCESAATPVHSIANTDR
eukprot:EG_transcript_8571